MTQTISRMYGSQDHAKSAVAELKKHRIYDGAVHMVTGPGGATNGSSSAGSSDGIEADIMKGYVVRHEAKVYAEGVRRGGSLVTVRAPWGSAALATEILNRFDPIDSGLAAAPKPQPVDADDDATPLSWLLNIPVLSKNPTPFASLWNVQTLTKGRASLSQAIGLPELARSGPIFPVGLINRPAMLPFPALSDNPAPFSGLLGWKVLSESPAPLSSSLNVATLSSEPAPLSKALHAAPLTGEQGSVSESLGIPELTSEAPPTPSRDATRHPQD